MVCVVEVGVGAPIAADVLHEQVEDVEVALAGRGAADPALFQQA